jgi:hypothetical protein
MNSASQKYFNALRKTSLLVVAVICSGFLFHSPIGTKFLTQEEPLKLSSLTVPVNGESMVSECPVVPAAAGIYKRNGQAGPGFNDREFFHSIFLSTSTGNSILNSYRQKLLNQKPDSPRLHLTLCVFLI